jgi:neutral ceramidase
MEALPRRIAEAVLAALQDLAPATPGYAQAEQRTVGHYRRAKLANGRVRNTWLLTPDADVVGPAGDIDPSLPILAFRAGDEWRALVANFACHATCAGDGRWSANYPGYFAASLADALGLGSDRVFYTSGAAANTNPRVTDAAEFGKQLADAVPPVLPDLTWRGDAALQIRERAITLPPRQIDSFPFALIEEVYGPRFNQLNFGRVVKYYANEYVKLIERGPVPVETALQVLALDDIALLAVPGELFVELGREIQQRSPFAHTLIVTHANDRIGYIPHQAAFAEGGYETIFASQSYLAPEAGAVLVEAAVDMLREMAVAGQE